MYVRVTDRGGGNELARRKCLDREKYYKPVALILSTLDYGCCVYSSAFASLLSSLHPVHCLGLRLALNASRNPLCGIKLTVTFRPCTLLSLQSFARLHQFSTSSFSSHPRLPCTVLVRTHTLLFHSPFPNFDFFPFHIHSLLPCLIPSPSICYSVFVISPSLICKFASYDPFSLNTFLLMPVKLLFLLMALVLPFFSHYYACPESL